MYICMYMYIHILSSQVYIYIHVCRYNLLNIHTYMCIHETFCLYVGLRSLWLRAVPKCHKHPAGPGQKWIHCRDIE